MPEPFQLNRRGFIAASAAALGGVSFASPMLRAFAAEPAAKPMRILILGGTGFLGPACTDSALARGHSVTHFNSGRTEERRRQGGRPSVVPAGVATLYGNRDPNKTANDRRSEGTATAADTTPSPKGLSQLEGKKWDAVIDTSGYWPRMVKASAELLASAVRQYAFISSISVYKDPSKPLNEDSPLQTLSDPASEDMGKGFENFGGGKALCEKAAESAMPGRVLNVRPGFIVGPRDTSARWLYWPVRIARGGMMIVPGDPLDPIQLIDVRDLADWLIHCIELNITGIFNATGPQTPLTMKAMVEEVRTGVGASTGFTWIDEGFLAGKGIGSSQFPLYSPPKGDSAYLHRCDITRALARGLHFRPLADTAKATLDWYKSLPADLQDRVAPQFASAAASQQDWLTKEKEALKAWADQKESKPKPPGGSSQ